MLDVDVGSRSGFKGPWKCCGAWNLVEEVPILPKTLEDTVSTRKTLKQRSSFAPPRDDSLKCSSYYGQLSLGLVPSV